MFKKIALTLTFLAAFSVAGFSLAPPSNAWMYYGRPYVNYYYGPPRAYMYGYGYAPYRAYNPYRTYYYGAPAARPYYNAYYGPGYYSGPIFR